MKKALVLYGSSRENGNTEYLTNYALEHTNKFELTRIYLRECVIEPLVDERHSNRPFPPVDDDYHSILQKMLEAEVVIFSSPVYWYNMSTKTKLFVDRWTESLRDPNIKLKAEMADKEMYVICTGANPNCQVVQPMIGIFKLMANYFDMEFKDYLWANADKPGEIATNQKALEKAKIFFDTVE